MDSSSTLRESPEARRSQILGEAIQVVGYRGSNGFRIQELAQRCGLSNAGLLYHFGSKEELLLAMLRELERRETAIIAPVAHAAEEELEQGAGSKQALVKFLRTMAERCVAHPELGLPFTVLQAEALEESHLAHQYFRNRDRLVLGLFMRLVAPHVEYPASAARQLLALLDGLGQQWTRENRGFDVVAEWDRAVAAVLGDSSVSNTHDSKRNASSPPVTKKTRRRRS